jgi:acyl carrier protein
MNKKEIKEKIRNFLSLHLKSSNFDDNTELFSSGLLTSLFAMQLILYVEKEYKIVVESQDLDFVNFNTVNGISNFVIKKIT